MYVVIEIQKFSDTSLSTLVDSYVDISDAESKYHTILAAASKSNVYQHSAAMLNDDGRIIKTESYSHEPQQEE